MNKNHIEAKTKFLLGALLSGYTSDAVVKFLSHAPLSQTEHLLLVHANKVRKERMKYCEHPFVTDLLNSIKQEPFAAHFVVEDCKSKIEQLSKHFDYMNARYGKSANGCLDKLLVCREGILTKEMQQYFGDVPCQDVLDVFAPLRNLCIGVVTENDCHKVRLVSDSNENMSNNKTRC